MTNVEPKGAVHWIDHYVVGGFYRVHTARGKDEKPGGEQRP